MKVKELLNLLPIIGVAVPNPEREIVGVYAGDLLSWVMGRAEEGNAWPTIMTNNNVIAVATLTDVSCVIICENCEVEETLSQLAFEKGVNLLKTPLTTYQTCAALAQLGL